MIKLSCQTEVDALLARVRLSMERESQKALVDDPKKTGASVSAPSLAGILALGNSHRLGGGEFVAVSKPGPIGLFVPTCW